MFKICFAVYMSILSPEPASSACKEGTRELMQSMIVACMRENENPFSRCTMTAVPSMIPRYVFIVTRVEGA